MKTSTTLSILSTLALAAAVPSAPAAVFLLEASLDGAQASAGAGTGSPGTGTANLSFDDATSQLDWTISWDDLLGNVTAMHFHGPATTSQNAGVQIGISDQTSPSIGNATLTASQAADLLNELYYINIHTSSFPGGEIRGQVLNVIPEPSSTALAGLALAGLLVRRRRR